MNEQVTEAVFGVRIVIANIPEDTAALAPARRLGETDEELARRSVLIRGLSPQCLQDATTAPLGDGNE